MELSVDVPTGDWADYMLCADGLAEFEHSEGAVWTGRSPRRQGLVSWAEGFCFAVADGLGLPA